MQLYALLVHLLNVFKDRVFNQFKYNVMTIALLAIGSNQTLLSISLKHLSSS